MDLETFTHLLSPAGQAALSDATALAPTEARFLAAFETLRKRYCPKLSKAALELVLLRVRARTKFVAAERMYFTRDALEQSSGDVAAGHRAMRFLPFGDVADLCCGIGGDAIAMAGAGLLVHAVEHDPLRLAMAKANASALGLSDRIRFSCGDALAISLPGARAAFADPGRRTNSRRYLNPEDYSPPLSVLRGRFPADFPLAVKVAPGVAWNDAARLCAEVEFVSVEGELKECVLWFGAFRRAMRRATVLPSGQSLVADESPQLPPLVPPAAYLFDPDPAPVRAGLAGRLASDLGISPIDTSVRLFTSNEPVFSPFLTTYRVELAALFNAAALRDHLRARGVGRVTIVKRGSLIDADGLMGKLKLAGKDHRDLVLTRAAGEPVMIVGNRLTASSP